jgi:hypothetical protein
LGGLASATGNDRNPGRGNDTGWYRAFFLPQRAAADAITSFFYVFEYDNYKLGISAILFALMWQICAFVYLAVAIYDWKQYRVYFDILGKPTGGIGGGSLRKEESAIPPGVITTTGVPIVAGGGSKATQSAVSSPPSSNDGEEKETGAAAASSSTTPLPNTVVLERPTVV